MASTINGEGKARERGAKMGKSNRRQPEFSTGERLSRLEALVIDVQPQLDRRFHEVEVLFGERLNGVRREMQAKADAQKEAVDKAEAATGRTFAAFTEQNDHKSEVTQNRLAAIERITSENTGASQGSRAFQASTVAWIGAAAAIGVVVVGLTSILVTLIASGAFG